MIVVIILISVFVLSAAIYGITSRKEQRNILQEALDAMENFTPTKELRSDNPVYYFAVDDKRQEMFCFSDSKGVRFRYKDIVSADIVVDGDVTETHKAASLGGALAGGLLAGGLGAVVGGSSMGKSKSVKKIKTVKVHILLRNARFDTYDFQLFNDGYEIKTDSYEYEKSYKNARFIFDALKLAMDKVKVDTPQPQTVASHKSNIEELKELAELKQQGLITEEEFATMKAKVINK